MKTKKRISSLLIAVMMVLTMVPSLAFAETTGDTSIEINETNFPDAKFREALKESLENGSWELGDIAEDGVLSVEEIRCIDRIFVDNSKITSLEGIEYFTNLDELYCRDNYLTELPENLPDSLTLIYCSGNKLTSLPENLPDNLKILSCSNNQLISLPETLPANLEELGCYVNQLTELPELPKGLADLACGDNLLVGLPELPDTLTDLSCYDNYLTELPTLPAGLKELYCQNNKLTTLPTLPSTLEVLYCNGNQLAKLPVIPEELTYLNAENNKIAGVLDLSGALYLQEVYMSDNCLTGVKLNADAKYENLRFRMNHMNSLADITGRTDLVWDIYNDNGSYYFESQKTYCEIYGHDYAPDGYKASVSQHGASSGDVYNKCKKCGDVDWDNIVYVPMINTIKLSTTSYTYNGKVKKPTVTVYDSNNKKISSSNYTVSYASGCKNVGKYKVTVKFKGDYYTGSRYVTFNINPKGTSVSKLTKAKKAFAVKWKKQSSKMAKSRITGYQYRYSTSSKMTSPKTVTVKGYSKTSAKKTGLKAKKKYYVQVRTYMTVSGTKYYSSWSKTKSVTTK